MEEANELEIDIEKLGIDIIEELHGVENSIETSEDEKGHAEGDEIGNVKDTIEDRDDDSSSLSAGGTELWLNMLKDERMK